MFTPRRQRPCVKWTIGFPKRTCANERILDRMRLNNLVDPLALVRATADLRRLEAVGALPAATRSILLAPCAAHRLVLRSSSAASSSAARARDSIRPFTRPRPPGRYCRDVSHAVLVFAASNSLTRRHCPVSSMVPALHAARATQQVAPMPKWWNVALFGARRLVGRQADHRPKLAPRVSGIAPAISRSTQTYLLHSTKTNRSTDHEYDHQQRRH